MIRIFSGILFVSFFSFEVFAEANEVFESSKDSIVKVLALGPSGETISRGSGVAIFPSGIITNKHVIENAFALKIIQNERELSLVETHASPDLDVAFLLVEELLPTLTLFEDTINVGQDVYALGNPLGMDLTLSQGIVSGIRGEFIQTTAPISPGSSGGALLTKDGSFVGMTTSRLREAQNINFAISHYAIFETELTEFVFKTPFDFAPKIKNGFVLEVTNREGGNSISTIDEGDILVDGHVVYATINSRLYGANEESTVWFESNRRIAFNCAANTYAELSYKMLAYDDSIIDQQAYNEIEWQVPADDNAGSNHSLVCQLKALSPEARKKVLGQTHNALILDVSFRVLRPSELLNLSSNPKRFTKLGLYLRDNVPAYEGLDNLL